MLIVILNVDKFKYKVEKFKEKGCFINVECIS